MSRVYNVTIERLPREKLEYGLQPLMMFSRFTAPSKVDLRPRLPACYDQGALGSCTANALVAAFQTLNSTFMGSRLFLYYNERLVENDIPDDVGSTLSTGIFCLKKYGVCSEISYPYIISIFARAPPKNCYTDALINRVVKATNVPQNAVSMKASLLTGFPIVIGFAVFESFESPEVAATGIVSMPGPNEQLLGGHAVLIVGYDDEKQWWIVRNSWGTGWGDKGNFYVPYAYFLDPNLSSDIWNITSITRPTPPKPPPPPPAKPVPKPAPKPKPRI